jgi:filamentous hemagglutinin family protein
MHKIQFLFASLFLYNFTINHLPVKAQITPDNTLGNESSQINSNVLIKGVNADQINGGATRETNLFHSFSEFNIKDGQRVYFANPSGVLNILTRVTGKNASSIFGTLGVDGNANLFLMNPNGILFGKNASLDVQGSFVGTTANGLQFGNQGVFSATNPEAPPLLTINPNALVFSQQQSGAVISNQSQAVAGKNPLGGNAFGLQVPDGKNLLLVGGNVSIDGGQLNAFGGRVELGGLAESGNVDLLFNGDNLSLKFPQNVTRADVSLTNKAGVYVTRAGGGNLAINARNLEILQGSILSAGIGQGLGIPDTVAGDITLNATGEIKVADSGSSIRNLVRGNSKGNGGNIFINSGSLSLRDGAQLLASTFGEGNAGNVNLKVTGEVDIAGFGGGIDSSVGAGAVGNGGNISIDAGSFKLQDGARLSSSTFGKGNAGNIDVKAGEISLLNASAILASTDSQSNSGNIIVNTNQLILQDGSFILTDALSNSTGRGGNITVKSTESIAIAGISEDNNASGLYAQTRGAGKAGDIQVTTRRLTVRDGGTISGETSGSGKAGDLTIDASELVEVIGGASNEQFSSSIGVQVSENASGDAGNLVINTKRLLVRDGAFITAGTRENSTGNGGSLLINATDSVELIGRKIDGEKRTAISVDVINGGKGNAGSITINTQRLVIKDGAEVAAKNIGSGQPGQILINADESVEVIGGKDTLTLINAVAAFDSTGKPGDISINTKRLLLQDGGQIAALTFGKVDGGSIQINATDSIEISGEALGLDNIFPFFRGSGISAVSVPLTDDVGGKGGDIKIKTGNLNLTNNGQISTATSVGVGIAGNAGNIEITSSKVTLDNQGKLSAESASGNGGNININSNLLLLRRGGQISTTAGTAQSGGDGGNINLNTKFIVAVPKENSDILANAFSGKGGNVNIQTQGIFGIEPRPKPTEKSDITASSELGVQGQVSIQKPDVDPSRGLIQLPGGFKDKSDQIDQLCGRGKKPLGRFVVVGKNGSIPSNPVVNPMQGGVDLTPLASLDESNSNN